MKKIKYLIVFVFTFILVITNYNAYTCKYTGDINEHKEWYELRDWFANGYVTLDVNENSIKVIAGDAEAIAYKFSNIENDNNGQFYKITDSEIYKEAFNGKCQSKINICLVSGYSAGSNDKRKAIVFNDSLIAKRMVTIGGFVLYKMSDNDCIWYSYSQEGSDKPSQDVVYECDSYSTLKTDLEEKHKTYNDCKKDDNKVCNTSYEEYLTAKEKIKNYCNDVFANLSANSSCSRSCLTLSTTIKELEKIDTNDGECGLSGNLIKWIKNILKWIKYILPVLVIILGIIDFIKAIASGSDDEMKKAQGKFIKRLIAAALLFLIPALIEFILNIFNIESAFCGVI